MRSARSAGAALFLPARCFALLLPVIGACAESRPTGNVPADRPPAAALALGGGSAHPFQPTELVPTDDSSWAAIDRGGREVWSYRVSGDQIAANRIYVASANIPEHVIALSANRGALTVLTSAGNVVELGARAGAESQRAHVDASHSRLLAFMSVSATSWGILEERVRVAAADDVTDSLVFREIAAGGADATRWAIRRGHYSSLGATLADFSAATTSGRTIVIGGAVPPRLWILTVDSGRVDVDTVALTGGVATRMSGAERAAMAASLGLHASPGDPGIPETLPTVGRVWPIHNGFLIQAAASSSESALDLYCGTAWKRRLLDNPGILDVGMLDHYVVVVRGPTTTQPRRLQLYARSALSAECE